MSKNGKIVIEQNPWRLDKGPILVLAGPGTGKTYQLAKRIQYLTKEKKVSPDDITVITFTSEAAKSMRSKLSDPENKEEYIETKFRPEKILTMHSLGHKIIQEDLKNLGLKSDFEVLVEDEIRELLMQDSALLVSKDITTAKKAFDSRRKGVVIPKELNNLIQKYESILRSCNFLDYDDLINLACILLSKNSEIKKKYATTYLLVDEYQDINGKQFELINLLKGKGIGLFVVGDDNQSIYGFRGGTPKYVRSFTSDFPPNARVLSLDMSRRCPEKVMRSATSIIDNFDKDRTVGKPSMRFEVKDAGKVVVHNCPSDDAEARIISKLIEDSIPSKSIYVLVPSRRYVAKIANSLRYRKVAFNAPLDFKNSGFRKLLTIKNWVQDQENSMLTRACIHLFIEAGVTSSPTSRTRKTNLKQKRHALSTQLATIWKQVIENKISYWQVLKKEAKKGFSLARELVLILEDLASENLEVSEFIGKASEKSKAWPSKTALFKELTEWFEDALKTVASQDNYEVRFLTMQGAKGLQADIVCVVGLENEVFPRFSNDEEKAEQARLLFVSMTRTKEELHLFHARKRDASVTFKKASYNLHPSEFVKSLPKDLIETRYYKSKS